MSINIGYSWIQCRIQYWTHNWVQDTLWDTEQGADYTTGIVQDIVQDTRHGVGYMTIVQDTVLQVQSMDIQFGTYIELVQHWCRIQLRKQGIYSACG